MSQKDPNFKVCLTKIVNIRPHTNPVVERLEIATCFGFDIIVSKGTYKVGDLVIYFPINSILPTKLESFLFPPDSKIKLTKSRVKAAKIQQFVSQGMIAPWLPVKELYQLGDYPVDTDLQEELNVVKFYSSRKVMKVGVPGVPKVRNKKGENAWFKQYNGCTNLKWVPNAFEENDEVWISPKVHGCLQANTLITLWDGQKTSIKDIVDNKKDVILVGYDKNNNPIPSKILNWFNNGVSKNWLKIKFERNYNKGGNTDYNIIKCTDNHKFYNCDKKEYIEAKFLNKNDKIFSLIKKKVLSKTQKSVVLGKLLGDGSICNNALNFGHKKEHEKYVDFTLKSLGDFAGNKQSEQTSGFGTIMTRGRSISSENILQIFNSFYTENNVKIIPSNIELDPISLAFWYMDDGSLAHSELQKDRACFATCGFDEQSIDNLITALNKLNIQGVKQKSENKYWRIRLNTEDAYKMFEMIRPYVPEVMQYKLPEEMRGDQDIEILCEEKEDWVLESRIVTEISEFSSKKESMSRYDLETETHNFIANNIIVHNSNFRCGYLPFTPPEPEPKPVLKWYQKLFDTVKYWFKTRPVVEPVVWPEFEFAFGSNTVQRQNKRNSPTWYGTDHFYQMIQEYELEEKLEKFPGFVLYGEIYGPRIQKGYGYGLQNDEKDLVIFDVMFQTKTETLWLSPDDAKEFVENLGLEFIPILYKGKWDQELATKLSQSKVSAFRKEQKIEEGVVVKHLNINTLERKKIKIINPEYLMGENETEDLSIDEEIEFEEKMEALDLHDPKVYNV